MQTKAHLHCAEVPGSVLAFTLVLSSTVGMLWTSSVNADQAPPGAPTERGPESTLAMEASETELSQNENLTPLELSLQSRLSGLALKEDLALFRAILKTQWILANLGDVDFDAAIDQIERNFSTGIQNTDLIVEMQRTLALGQDGHAVVSALYPALRTVGETYPDFIVDICGKECIAYRVERLPHGPVNPRYRYRLTLLRNGYPFLRAIDGISIHRWLEEASRLAPKGPDLAVRWNSMYVLHHIPYLRRELGLSQKTGIRVTLGSGIAGDEVDVDAPIRATPWWHLRIPKADWTTLNGNIGYISIQSSAAGGSRNILEAMPKLRTTSGLVIDVRGNRGGAALETLALMAAFLLPPDQPRTVVGAFVQWRRAHTPATLLAHRSDQTRLTRPARETIERFESHFHPSWTPPAHRGSQVRYVLLARPEAEPDLAPWSMSTVPRDTFYHYDKPVVVLFDHRSFSSAELFLAGMHCLNNVTLVGSTTTAGGASSGQWFTLANSQITFWIADTVFARRGGELIDGNGIPPDIPVEPDVDYYLGKRDRALDIAVDALTHSRSK